MAMSLVYYFFVTQCICLAVMLFYNVHMNLIICVTFCIYYFFIVFWLLEIR